MSVQLSELLSETIEVTRNSTTGSLDNTKRTRGINRVLEDLQDFADWEFTKRSKEFDFISGVTEYSLLNHISASCLDNDGSTSITDFKNPYSLILKSRSNKPFSYEEVKTVRENIGRGRTVNQYSVDNDLLVVNYPEQSSAQLHNCDSLTANGTVAVSGDASNLTIDTVEYDEGSGALNFDVVAGTSLVVTFTGISAKDLTTLQNKSYLTLKAWLPTITNFTSIKARWGSSASDYWEKTETVPAGSRELKTGRNIFAFKWGSATETGTPDVTAIDYVQITLTYSGATTDTDFRIDDIRIAGAVEMELNYYSLAMVKTAAGTYQLEFNPDSVTMDDELLGGSTARRCVVEGVKHELFDMIGGKSERDRTDSFTKYNQKKIDLLKRAGHRIRRPSQVLNFPSGR